MVGTGFVFYDQIININGPQKRRSNTGSKIWNGPVSVRSCCPMYGVCTVFPDSYLYAVGMLLYHC